MIFSIWIVFHVLTCIGLVLVVLMQSAKGEGLAGGTAFGGGATSAVFGGRGTASLLSKATTALAIVFLLNCVALAYMSASSNQTATVPTDGTGGESAVTRQAQQAIEEAQQRQEALQLIQDTAGTDGENLLQDLDLQTQPNTADSPTTAPAETGGN